MNRSDQIRAALRQAGCPLSMAQLSDANGWDVDERTAASTNLGQMRKRGELVVSIVDGRSAYALAPDYVPGRGTLLHELQSHPRSNGASATPRAPLAPATASPGPTSEPGALARVRERLEAGLRAVLADNDAGLALFDAYLDVVDLVEREA